MWCDQEWDEQWTALKTTNVKKWDWFKMKSKKKKYFKIRFLTFYRKFLRFF